MKEYKNIVNMSGTRHDLHPASRKKSVLNQFSDMRGWKRMLYSAVKYPHISRMLPLNSIALSVFIRKHKAFIYLSFFRLHRSYFVAPHTPRSFSPSLLSLFASKSFLEGQVCEIPIFHAFPVL